MATSKAANPRKSRRRLPLTEKRRIVELTLREGASVRAIAREHGVSRNSLYQWQALYRAGKLTAQPVPDAGAVAPSATFLPVGITPAVRSRRASDSDAHGSSVVHLMFASGAMLRIEGGALDAELLGRLVGDLRR